MIRDTVEQCILQPDPVERPDYTEAEVQALRALERGQATPDQQSRALQWFIRACGTYDTSFRPQSDRLTAFAEGRRHAGTNLVWMLNSAPTKTDPDKISTRIMGEMDE